MHHFKRPGCPVLVLMPPILPQQGIFQLVLLKAYEAMRQQSQVVHQSEPHDQMPFQLLE